MILRAETLTKKKDVIMNFIEAILHNKTDLKKGCIPQTERDDG